MVERAAKLTLFGVIFVGLTISYLNSAGRKPPAEAKTLEEKLARKFHIEENAVLDLKEKNYSFEEIVKILILSTAANKKTDEIRILLEEGLEWDDMYRKFGIDQTSVEEETVRILEDIGVKEKVNEKEEIQEEEEIKGRAMEEEIKDIIPDELR